ncbi:hypothetical protein DERP_002529 [Dermatophagoides pteronyssinus]|uniref:Uncharacterized protein n=1 Tax=Dermatophagoides pteronyssinus TaxID=6956 RepID=A0ABQ8JIG8_DERPT|nr:hypothetical protein DERP_002529 [Dermatophagoides pteronyssinus]
MFRVIGVKFPGDDALRSSSLSLFVRSVKELKKNCGVRLGKQLLARLRRIFGLFNPCSQNCSHINGLLLRLYLEDFVMSTKDQGEKD